MSFYSTNKACAPAALEEALFRGLAPDGGLYLPEVLNPLPDSFFPEMKTLSFEEIAYQVAKAFIGDAVKSEALQKIVRESFNFPIPLVSVEPNIWALELFHGPTLSFKDFGARFMARLFHYFLDKSGRPLDILVATSGDTGSAAAHGFYRVPGIRVWILYPKGQVSAIQEQQMTTLGENVAALEVAGTFDDCQRLVKAAFQDRELNRKLQLTSANSINIARLIPQTFYYFYAYSRLPDHSMPLAISVPSGNFGNLTGGIMAKRMGLPVDRFIAATNINDIVPKYLETGKFEPRPSTSTLANAMDVGNPSNFARMLELFSHDWQQMREELVGASFTNVETVQAMQEVKKAGGYQMDPHGAIAYLGLKKYFSTLTEECQGIFLETAHPAKFGAAVGIELPIPERLSRCLQQERIVQSIAADEAALKAVLLENQSYFKI